MSSTRVLRVNELILREMSALLRRKYNADAAPITLSAVKCTPDVREAVVYVSVTGEDEQIEEAMRWLRRHNRELRLALGEIIVLKHMPKFTFELDTVVERGNRILGILDEIVGQEKKKSDEQT